MSPLHPRMAEIVERMDAAHRALHDAVAGLSDDAAARRPAPERWSVAMIVDHLRRAESGTVRLFHHLNQKAAALPPETVTTSKVAALAGYTIEDRVTRPLTSPPVTAPDPAVRLSEALAGYDAVRLQVLAAIEGSDGRAVEVLQFAHPLIGPLDYYQWVLFTAEHEVRHTEQLLEVRRELGLGPGG